MPRGTIDLDLSMRIRNCIGEELQSRVRRGKLVGKALLKDPIDFDKAVKSVNKRIMRADTVQPKY